MQIYTTPYCLEVPYTPLGRFVKVVNLTNNYRESHLKLIMHKTANFVVYCVKMYVSVYNKLTLTLRQRVNSGTSP